MFDSTDYRSHRYSWSDQEDWLSQRSEGHIEREIALAERAIKRTEGTLETIKEVEGVTYEMGHFDHDTIRPQDFAQWLGRVIEIQEDRFIAKIDSLNMSMLPKIVTFNIHKSRILNGEYLEEGASFVWTVGLYPKSLQDRTLVKRSEIQFRLIQDIDADYIDVYAREKARELIEGISWLE